VYEQGGFVMRRVLVVLLGVFVLALMPAAAYAGTATPARGQTGLVVFSGDASVASDETVDSVVVFSGAATVDGTVTGSVVVFSGPVTISGNVRGDVVVFDGLLTVQSGAHIAGDVFADRRAIAPGAQIDGNTASSARLTLAAGWAGVALWVAMWLVFAVSLLLFGLILLWFAPRAADAAIVVGRTAVGPSIGWGAALFFGLPLISILAMVTVVGLPIGLGLLFALGLIYAIGMIAGAWFLGRLIVKTGSRAGAYALGWAILTVGMLIPGIGGLAWVAATWYGLGILCVAAFRARKEPSGSSPAPAPMPTAPVKV